MLPYKIASNLSSCYEEIPSYDTTQNEGYKAWLYFILAGITTTSLIVHGLLFFLYRYTKFNNTKIVKDPLHTTATISTSLKIASEKVASQKNETTHNISQIPLEKLSLEKLTETKREPEKKRSISSQDFFLQFLSHESTQKLMLFIKAIQTTSARVSVKGSALIYWLMLKYSYSSSEEKPNFTPHDIDLEIDCSHLSPQQCTNVIEIARKFGFRDKSQKNSYDEYEKKPQDKPFTVFENMFLSLKNPTNLSFDCDLTIQKPGFQSYDPILFTRCRGKIDKDGIITTDETEAMIFDFKNRLYRIIPPSFEKKSKQFVTCFLMRSFKYYNLLVERCRFTPDASSVRKLFDFQWLVSYFNLLSLSSLYAEMKKLFIWQRDYYQNSILIYQNLFYVVRAFISSCYPEFLINPKLNSITRSFLGKITKDRNPEDVFTFDSANCTGVFQLLYKIGNSSFFRSNPSMRSHSDSTFPSYSLRYVS